VLTISLASGTEDSHAKSFAHQIVPTGFTWKTAVKPVYARVCDCVFQSISNYSLTLLSYFDPTILPNSHLTITHSGTVFLNVICLVCHAWDISKAIIHVNYIGYILSANKVWQLTAHQCAMFDNAAQSRCTSMHAASEFSKTLEAGVPASLN